MLQIANHTPFAATLSVFPDADGVETAYAVVKGSFLLGADGPVPAPQPLPLLAADVFWGDPQTTSLRAPTEFSLLRPATDVLLLGRAIAPAPGTRVADVTLEVGPLRRSVRVFGNRHWQRSGGGWRISLPEPWERMPLRWELAFGGGAPVPGADGPEHDLRNPVGCGLVARGAEPVEGQPLPNLEDPASLIQTPRDRPVPACFAPIAPTWLPRRAHAGTYDEAWTRTRAPYLPLDFDARFFQTAPPALIAPGWLRGGEPVRVTGCSVGGPLQFALPDAGLELAFDFDGRTLPRQPQLEQVLIEPDAGRLQMLWRAALPVDKKLLRLSRVQVRSSAWGADGRPPAPLAGLGALPAGYAAA